jgi:hypothetical protein
MSVDAPTNQRQAVDQHTVETTAVMLLVKRVVELEMLRKDVLPTGLVRVTMRFDFGYGRGGDGYAALCPHTINERLVNIANRCKSVLECNDREGDDLVLVRGRGARTW